MSNPFESSDWTEESLQEIWQVISKIAKEEFKITYYEPSFEIVTFEEMLQIYTTSFPVMFNHWSFGKNYENLYKQYKYNRTSIAYEVIFNTNPALCYLLETNTTTMQALVMSHAAIGHSAFFKNNEFFIEHTNAGSILSYLKNVREYVTECEKKYGNSRVEEILDTCCALSLYSVDRSEAITFSKNAKEQRRIKREQEQEKDFDTLVTELGDEKEIGTHKKVKIKSENLLKYIADNSPSLKDWEKQIILMYCKVQQYFYPQILTKVMNEGYASFWHYELMNRLYDLGHLNDGNIMEFLHSHTSVLCQRDHDEKGYSGVNPYKLGFEIFNDIKRICLSPTEEDKRFFPGLIGKDWVEEVNYAAANFKDSSFILQYLSPKLVRRLKLFKYTDDSREAEYEITAVHSDEDFKEIRKSLSDRYNIFGLIPHVYIEGCDLKYSRSLYLNAVETRDQQIHADSFLNVCKLMKKLWNYPIKLKYYTFSGDVHIGEIK